MPPILIAKKLSPKAEGSLIERLARMKGDDGRDLPDVQAFLWRHYKEGHRSYHNLSHLYSLFMVWDHFAASLPPVDKPTISWAIWFHDLIYRPLRKDNEEKSAEAFREYLGPYLSPSLLRDTSQIILSTQDHTLRLGSPEELLILDLDLAVLGAPAATYAAYARAVREEFRQTPSFLYRPGRRKVLQHFLDRPNIYGLTVFRENLEEQARLNLNREIDQLSS